MDADGRDAAASLRAMVAADLRRRSRTPEPTVAIPLSVLALCLDCRVAFRITTYCPSCGRASWFPAARWLDR